ncbi:MAG: tetratricopeptide repeat protein, partial [Opitutales bacterium]
PLLFVSLCLPLIAANGENSPGINERFRIADDAYRRALAGEGDWQQVLAYYRHLGAHSEKRRHQERAYLGLAEAHMAMGKLWKASDALDRVVGLDGKRRDWALYRKGMLGMMQVRNAADSANARAMRQRAVKTYERLADEHPDSPLAPQALFFVANNELLHLRRPNRAERAYRELIERYPNSDEASRAAKALPAVHRLTDKQLDAMSR